MLDTLNPFRKSLLAQIVASFSLLSLVTITLVSYSAYHQAREGIEEEVYNHLNSAISLKEYQLIQWFKAQRREATVLARSPLVVDAIHLLINESANTFPGLEGTRVDNHHQTSTNIFKDATDSTTVETDAAITLQNYLKLVTEIEDNLYSIDILTQGGTVILSNQADRKGQVIPLEKTTYFESERALQTKEPSIISPNIYLNAGVPTITLVTPVIDKTGRALDILVATTPKFEPVNHIIRQRAGLGESGEAYLVKTIEGRNIFLAGTPAVTGFSIEDTTPSPHPASGLSRPDSTVPSTRLDAQNTKLSSQGIEQSMKGKDSEGLYQNYRNVPVVGVYRWLDQYEVALLAEVSQEEAFQPAFFLARKIFTVGILTAGLLVVLVYVLARHIVHPVLLMSRAAVALETNRFQPAMLQTMGDRPDELGQLARTFIRMAEHMSARQARLKAKIQQGNERISKLFEEKTSSNTKINAGKQQASELELAYYDALKRKATWLRQQSVTQPK